MNKKIYLKPTTVSVAVKSKSHILSGSVQNVSGADGMGKGEDWTSGEANARGNQGSSVWDD